MNDISLSEKKKKKNIKQNFELFFHVLPIFEIIWMRIGQVIRLQKDINFSEML